MISMVAKPDAEYGLEGLSAEGKVILTAYLAGRMDHSLLDA